MMRSCWLLRHRRAGHRVVEFGAGVGTAGLALARRVSGLDLVLAEIDESLAALARVNAAANDISAQVLTFDVTRMQMLSLPSAYARQCRHRPDESAVQRR
jgi:tRNA1(Val) A37 N6-methylase TrmN6